MKKIMFVALALIFGLVSCVKDKQYPGITIKDIQMSPATVTPSIDVTVTATIQSFTDFSAKLVYIIDAQPTTLNMEAGTDNIYSAVIPGQPDSTIVNFYIEAANSDFTLTSEVKSYTVGAAQIDFSKLRLNEINGNDKFIEIYNDGQEAIPMNGVYIEKDNENKWTADNTIILEPGAFLLLYSNKVLADHPDHPANLFFDGGISASKPVRVQLFTPSGSSVDDFNLVTCVTPAEASYSRNADGNWYHSVATPNAANIDGTDPVEGLETPNPPTPPTPDPDYKLLVLNEINGNDKFIEIYNSNPVAINMEGVYIEKDNEQKWVGDNSITLEPGGYLLLYSNKVQEEHPDHPANLFFDGGISASKPVRVQLFAPNQESINDFNLVTLVTVAQASYSRNSDDLWYHAEATPGAHNIDGTDPVEGLE